MRFTVTSPVDGFSGEVAGVMFARGTATCDSDTDNAALVYFRRKGYGVTQADVPVVESTETKNSRKGKGASE